MSQRRISLRIAVSFFLLTTISVFAFGGWMPGMNWLDLRTASAVAPREGEPESIAVIGTCDTAGPIEVESTAGTTAPTAYATLKLAFDAINAGTHTGAINVEVCGNTAETASAILNSGAIAPASYTGVTIRPVGAGRVIEGSIVGAIIKLNGADDVTIDGRQGGTGSARDLAVRNTSTTAATAAVWLASVAAGNGTGNNTVRNLEISAGVDQSVSGTATFGIIMSGTTISVTANGVDNDNNSFIANRITKARYGIVTRGTTTDLNINPIITDNIVGPSAFGPDQIGKVGILLQADSGALVSRNTVQYVGCLDPQLCSGADRMGIAIGNESWSSSPGTITSNTYTVTKNIVHDVIDELTFSAVGIDLATTGGGSATSNRVANNFIYNVRANGTGGDMAIGLGIAGGHTDTVAFNTIVMTGDVDPGASGASTNYGSGIRIANANSASHANLTLSNNSVYMDLSSSSGPTVRYYAISGPSTGYSFGTGGENYNNYYVNPANPQSQTGGLGTANGAALTTQFANLANWQAAYTVMQDANSIQADPLHFSNTADVHIQQASPNVNAGSTVAGITEDIDAQARPNAANPDIGADEFYPAPGSIQLSAAGYSVTEAGLTATITATRAAGGNGAVSVDFATVAGGTAMGGGTCSAGIDYVDASGTLNWADLDIAPKTFAVTVCNDVTAEPDETVNLVISNPTGGATVGSPGAAQLTILNSTVFGASVNVGSAEAVTSLTNPGGLFNQINNSVLSGNLSVNITSDLTAETGAIALNQFGGGFTLTIRPAGGARVISGGSATVLLDFDGADGVIIDGLNTGGNSLTIRNTAAGTGTAVRYINDASNNSLTNSTLEGGGTSSVLAISTGVTTGNDGLSIVGNTIRDRTDAASVPFNVINLIGSSASVSNSNIAITGNQLINFAQAGIVIGASDSVTVNNNEVSQSSSRTTALTGIAVNSAGGTNSITNNKIHDLTTTLATTGIALNDARDTTVARNRIYNFPSATGSTGVLSGIVFTGSSGTNATVTLVNNMVSIVPGFTNAQIIRGIYDFAFAGNTFNAYYNSVLVSGAGSGASSSWACVRGTSAPTAFTMTDNICFNNRTGGTGNHFAAGDQTNGTGTFASNYNIFVGTGATAANFFDKGTASGGTPVDFAAWQAGGRDANSQSSNPTGNYTVANMFLSAADLHLNTTGTNPASDAGTPLTGVTTDFDGNNRSATTPEIGADEIAPPNTPPTITAAAGVTRQAGSPVSNSTIATVTDAESGNGAVAVTVTTANPSNGVTVSNIVNTNGTITANVAAACGATNATFTLQASDGTNTATATLNVAVTANTGPVLTFSNASVAAGGSTSVNPTTGPTDNGSVAAIAVQSTGTYTGTIAVNNTTGVVSASNAAPAGVHTITIRATDNCGTTTDASFTLTVSAPAGPVAVTATAATQGPTNYATLKGAIDAVNAGTHQGIITVSVVANTTETGSIVLNASGAGSAVYTSLVIRPVTNGVTVAGPSAGGRGLIELNGADNVTIDGDNPNTAGTNRNLTLQNTATNATTFTSVVRIALAATVVNSADNNIVRNLNILGSATGRNIPAATATAGSENNTFGIIAGPGGSTTSNTTAPAALTSVSTSLGAGATATNLVVSNNAIGTAGRGISMNGAATSVFPGLQITGNVIGNATAGAADQVYAIGITAQGSANGIISRNTVWVEGNIASSASTHGINVGVNSATGTFTIDSNTVNRVRNGNPGSWSAYGINLGGGINHVVQNNFVSGVINDQTTGTGAFGTTFGAYGIRISSGTGHKVYHNSVNLYGPLGGVTNTDLTASMLVSAVTLTGIDVRNNIFANRITGGNPTGTRHAAIFLPSGGTSAMNLTLNNNAYYTGTDANSRLAQVGTTFGTGEFLTANFDPTSTAPAANLRSYTSTLSAAGTNDNASFAASSPTPFTSDVNLHIPPGTASRLESGGAGVGVAADIDAETRNVSTPDIGADEFAGLPPLVHDMLASALVTPANGANILTGQNFAPQATFTNNGTVVETNVTVRYRIIDMNTTAVYNQTAVIASIGPLQNATVTFPSTSIAIPGPYTIHAAAELGTDLDSSNDSISGAITVVPPLEGMINVGVGEIYSSLTNPGGLFQTLNTGGISSDLTVQITSDLTGETGAVALNQIAETGAGGYTVTFKPSGLARTISGTSAASSGLIILNGADRIVFDGSLSGGTDRSLTITNSQVTTGVVVWMRSPNVSNGATNNTIKNCIINGAPGPNSTTVAGVLAGSGITLGNDAEAPNSNNTIQNNWIYRVQNSLYLRGGASAPAFDQNWNVIGNEFGSATAADKNIFRGMLIGNSQNFAITANTIRGVQSTGSTTAAMSGIQVALLVNTGLIANNVISDIKNVSATGTGAFGVHISASSTASNVTIANNFVSDVAAAGSATATSNGFGMMFNGSGTGYNVYFNSVNMSTNQTNAQLSAALHVHSTFATAGALNVRNNIFANTQTTGTRYGVYSTAAPAVFTTVDFNDYFAQNVGFIGGSARTALADWQAATSQDVGSKAVDPLFVSASDLHIQPASTMINMGVVGTGITTDIDGNTRDAAPDIGADEVPGTSMPGALRFSNAAYSGGEAGSPFTVTVTRTGGTDGSVSVNYATSNGSATGGASCTAGVDYIANSGTLTFAAGVSSQTFNVVICNDTTVEPSETINYTLANPTGGAVLGTPSSAVQTIVDDEVPAAGTLSINDVRVTEGNGGTTNATFTVTYSGSSAVASVQYATANGTATAGTDYVLNTGTLNFGTPVVENGIPVQTRSVTVVVNGELAKEANETFFVNLSNPTNATIADAQGVGIIIDEDRAYVADFDRDRASDFSVFRPSEGFWYVLQSTTGTPRIVPLGSGPGDLAAPGDFDADGRTDFAVFRPSQSTWLILNSGDNTLRTMTWGLSEDKPVQGDYDGDSKTDIAIFRPSTGAWWVVRSSDSTWFAFNFGISTDRPVQGDYDGDAKTDVAVYRDGVWYIFSSAAGSIQIQTFGIASDKPVSGDFDGDGKFDLAIYRGGEWWVLNSLTGTARALRWGLANDIPVSADYDADGTTDFAVFRPSTGIWYVLSSTSGMPFGVQWGLASDIAVPAAYLPQ